eukprot:m.172694 g.172694  ORF g.172694 m.172694 type:complete len:684 (-) comp31698_c5_seq2:53-2104(-)
MATSTTSASSASTKFAKEFSAPNNVADALGFDSEHLLRSENIPFDIDNWYPSLKKWTFKTVFVPMSRAEARAIVRYQWMRYSSREGFDQTENDTTTLEALEKRLDDTIYQESFSESGCFMRLCGRSAKDAEPLDRERIRQEYTAALDELRTLDNLHNNKNDVKAHSALDNHNQKPENGNKNKNKNTQSHSNRTNPDDKSDDANNKNSTIDSGSNNNNTDSDSDSNTAHNDTPELKMRAAARVSVLKCLTGAEVMSQLLSSERVYSDMLDWLWYGEPEQIVLRQWQPEISLDFEFRLYVHNNKLCGISQYDHYAHYSHLQPLKQMLQQQMISLWEEIHPSVGSASYGMDLVYLSKSKEFKFLELSPFLRCTGAHCFRWNNPIDVDVLEGRSPFEFRLVEQSVPQFSAMFANGWEQRWNPSYGERNPAKFWESYQTTERRKSFELELNRRRRARPLFALSEFLFGVATRTFSFFPDWLRSTFTHLEGGDLDRVHTCEHLLFVYGTLKQGMHWHSKFLSHGAQFVGRATTVEQFPLVVGRCGVPYLLCDGRGTGHRVLGELYKVSEDALEGLDQYEGLVKQYYTRPTVQVELTPSVSPLAQGTLCHASVYGMVSSPPALRQLTPRPEYTLDFHQKHYRAIEHIQLKQQLYLQGHNQYSRKDEVHSGVSVESDTGPETNFAPVSPFF